MVRGYTCRQYEAVSAKRHLNRIESGGGSSYLAAYSARRHISRSLCAPLWGRIVRRDLRRIEWRDICRHVRDITHADASCHRAQRSSHALAHTRRMCMYVYEIYCVYTKRICIWMGMYVHEMYCVYTKRICIWNVLCIYETYIYMNGACRTYECVTGRSAASALAHPQQPLLVWRAPSIMVAPHSRRHVSPRAIRRELVAQHACVARHVSFRSIPLPPRPYPGHQTHIFDKRDPHTWQKRPTYLTKETHIFGNRDLHTYKKTNKFDKRNRHIRQKRPTYWTIETNKPTRDLKHTQTQNVGHTHTHAHTHTHTRTHTGQKRPTYQE